MLSMEDKMREEEMPLNVLTDDEIPIRKLVDLGKLTMAMIYS